MAYHPGPFCVISVSAVLLCITFVAALSGTRMYGFTWRVQDSWRVANSCCQKQNMELVTVDSQEKLKEVTSYVWVLARFWIGLQADDVGNMSTYRWSDGTPFDVTSIASVPFDPASMQSRAGTAGPTCFQVEKGVAFVVATACDMDTASLLCELKEGFEQVPQKYTGQCSGWNTFLKENSTQGQDPRAARWRLGWEPGLRRVHYSITRPNLASVSEDCVLYCQAHASSSFRGVQTELRSAGIVACTCVI